MVMLNFGHKNNTGDRSFDLYLAKGGAGTGLTANNRNERGHKTEDQQVAFKIISHDALLTINLNSLFILSC